MMTEPMCLGEITRDNVDDTNALPDLTRSQNTCV